MRSFVSCSRRSAVALGNNTMRRVDLRELSLQHQRIRSAEYSSLFRSSGAERLRDDDNSGNKKGAKTKDDKQGQGSFRRMGDAAARETRQKIVAKVEVSVRERLQKEFPNELEASWFGNNNLAGVGTDAPVPLLTLSSFRTLLALNGFQKVVTPTGTKSRLYLAEGVVATPPMKLSFNATAIPFASGYQEFARGMEINNVGVFGDVHKLVRGGTTKRKNRLFAQPLERSQLHPDDGEMKTPTSSCSSTTTLSSSTFPEFVQEDITLYRWTENSAARFVDRTYSSWTGWTQRRFVRPLRDAKYRTRVALKSANAMRAKMRQILEKSIVERVVEELRAIRDKSSASNTVVIAAPAVSVPPTQADSPVLEATANNEKDVTAERKSDKMPPDKFAESLTSSPSSAHENDNGDEEHNDHLETLVVISSRPIPRRVGPTTGFQRSFPNSTSGTNNNKNTITIEGDEIVDSVTLYRHMTPSTRILALPDYYVLRHSSASTLVAVSLVVFGALPLAYRSYVFSIDYDWLVGSGTIAASVIATITYGILSARWRARTSQSKTLHEGLGARVGARDEAALLLLKDGAIRSVTKAVLEAAGEEGDSTNANSNNSSSASGVAVGGALIDPREWAIDFGLMEEQGGEGTKPTTATSGSVNNSFEQHKQYEQ